MKNDSFSPIKALKFFGMFFIVGNLFFLDYVTYTNGKLQQIIPTQTNTQKSTSNTISPSDTMTKQLDTALTKIKNIETVLFITPSIIPSIVQVNSVKEYYIPFGSGTSQAADWTDIPGLQAYVDTTLYPSIKNVTFEIGGHTPTGNQIVSVRLYNVTDSHLVWNSEVSWSGGGSQFVVSNPITLDTGNKLYKIQMKTQVQSLSYLDQAKIHIILN